MCGPTLHASGMCFSNGGGVRAGDAGVESWLQQEMGRGSHDIVHLKDIFALSCDQPCRHQVLG